MENRVVAALVSSLVSQALLLFFSLPTPTAAAPNFLHLLAFSSASHVAATTATQRKRKRLQPPDDPDESEEPGSAPAAVVAPISVRRQPDHYRVGFGMAASTFEWLAGLLEPLLDCCHHHHRAPPLPAAARLALGLSRLATGAPYADIARRFGVAESAARSCARLLCRVLCTNFRFWLAFPPNSDDHIPISAGFESAGGLPGCCGAVACARFEIRAAGDDTVAAQIVSDASSRILHIATGFRGEMEDFTILRRSSLYRDAEAGRLLRSPESYLIGGGGGGYPLLPWLMVPFVDPTPGSLGEEFNAVHRLMLRPAIRTVSSLKNWGVLSRPIEGEEDVKAAVACIATCAILHNALLMREDYSLLAEESEDFSEDDMSCCRPREGTVSEEYVVEEKAIELRNALSEKAREVPCSDRLQSQ